MVITLTSGITVSLGHSDGGVRGARRQRGTVTVVAGAPEEAVDGRDEALHVVACLVAGARREGSRAGAAGREAVPKDGASVARGSVAAEAGVVAGRVAAQRARKQRSVVAVDAVERVVDGRWSDG